MKLLLTAGISIALLTSGCAQLSTLNTGSLSSLVESGTTIFKSAGNLFDALGDVGEPEEYYVGRSVAANILTKYSPYGSSRVNNYVQKVGAVVSAASERPEIYGGYHFQVLNSKEVNAFAAPGGFVFITRGFLRLLPDEDALAAVLAHEVSHVTLKHGIDSMDLSKATSALADIGGEVASYSNNEYVSTVKTYFGDSVNELTDSIINNGYSRGQEYSADENALILMKRAGYNPSALATVIGILEETSKTAEGGLFTNHPDMEDRKEDVLDELDEYIESTPEQKYRAKRFRANTSGV